MTTWQYIRQEDPGEPFGGQDSLNHRPYPDWWPPRAPYRGYNLLEALYGFPFLSWWSFERNGFPKCPKINIETFRPPTEALLSTMPRLDELGEMWSKASKPDPNKSWIDLIGRPMAEFWDSLPGKEHYQIWESYLVENCRPQLQFFGVPFKSVDNQKEIFRPISTRQGTSLFFQEPLNYCPGKWTLMVVFSLMIAITHQVKSRSATPFILWDSREDQHRTIIYYVNMSWFDDRSAFTFPILSWIKTKDEAQVTLLSKRFRGDNSGSYFFSGGLNEGNLESWTKDMSAFLCFIRAYNKGVFNQLNDRETYYIMNKGFKILYVSMLERLTKNPSWPKSFKLIDGPSGVYSSPYSNLRSQVDWMMWSMMVMWLDLKKNHQPLTAKIRALPVNENHYRYIFVTLLEEFGSNTKIDLELDEWVEEQKNAPDKIWDGVEGRHIELPFRVKDNVFGDFLTKFQNDWRKTAEYYFLGINAPKWPPEFPQLSFSDPDSLDAKMYNFMSVNPPRKLRVPAIDPVMFQRHTNKWESVFKHQYVYYMEWVYYNIKGQVNPNYTPPGVQLKDPKGQYITISDAGSRVQIINSFPDLIMAEPDNKGFTLSKAVSFLIIPIDQAAKFIWGDDWTQFLDQLGKKIWTKIKDSLKELANFVIDLVLDNLPDIGKILLLVGGVVLGGVLGVTFLEEEVKKLAK